MKVSTNKSKTWIYLGREKKRIGGDWAVASILVSRGVRSYLRSVLGPDLVILCLTMSDSERRQRILQRHAGDTNSADWMDVSLHHPLSLPLNIIILFFRNYPNLSSRSAMTRKTFSLCR